VPAARKRLLIICERDVGLFSLIQQVIANIPRAIAEERIPVVLFGEQCSYFTSSGYQGSNSVWEYYFEPVAPQISAADIPADVVAAIEAAPPHPLRLGLQVDEFCFASSNFGDHRLLSGKALSIPFEWDDPTDALRQITQPIIERYIRPRAYLQQKVDRFYDEHLKDRPLIGVQVRGTDAVSKHELRSSRIGSLRRERYFAEIDAMLLQHPDARIFVATDAEESLAMMKDRYGGKVVAYESVRHQSGEAAGRGPTGGLMPAYIAQDPDVAARNGEEVVIEYLLLCRCDSLVHNGAGLARTVLLAKPDMPHRNTNQRNRLVARIRSLGPRQIMQTLRGWRYRFFAPA
jgi:hypothetical protein